MRGEFAFLLWAGVGLVAQIIECNRMKTWCGIPIWQEPSTYVICFIAMLLGPTVIILNRLWRE